MLSEEQVKEQLEILDRTNMHKNAAKERVIPEDYLEYQTKVERTERMLESVSTGVAVRCVFTKAVDCLKSMPIFINLHGGGFIHPQDSDDDLLCAHIANAIQGLVIDVDYAVTPYYVFPTAFEQVWDVAEWVFAHAEELKADSTRISIGGHSAGGALAAAVCLRAAKSGHMHFALQILDYAALDNAMAFETAGNERSRAFSTLYCGGNIRLLSSPYCSPVFASDEMLKNQPRTLVINAEFCPFRKITERYGQRLAQAGNEVAFKSYRGSAHGFTVRMTGAWQDAQELMIRYLRNSKVREVQEND